MCCSTRMSTCTTSRESVIRAHSSRRSPISSLSALASMGATCGPPMLPRIHHSPPCCSGRSTGLAWPGASGRERYASWSPLQPASPSHWRCGNSAPKRRTAGRGLRRALSRRSVDGGVGRRPLRRRGRQRTGAGLPRRQPPSPARQPRRRPAPRSCRLPLLWPGALRPDRARGVRPDSAPPRAATNAPGMAGRDLRRGRRRAGTRCTRVRLAGGVTQLRVRYYQGIASQRPYAYFVWADPAAWLVSCSPLLAVGVDGP